jgi:hypothetical protein
MLKVDVVKGNALKVEDLKVQNVPQKENVSLIKDIPMSEKDQPKKIVNVLVNEKNKLGIKEPICTVLSFIPSLGHLFCPTNNITT